MAADSRGPTYGGRAGGGGAEEPGHRGGSGGPRRSRWFPATEVEAGIKRAAVEPEQQRTEEETRG